MNGLETVREFSINNLNSIYRENPTDSTLPLVTVERAGLLGSKVSV